MRKIRVKDFIIEVADLIYSEFKGDTTEIASTVLAELNETMSYHELVSLPENDLFDLVVDTAIAMGV